MANGADHLLTLLEEERKLVSLFQKAKSIHESGESLDAENVDTFDCKQVKEAIEQLLKRLKDNAQGPYFEISMSYLTTKIKWLVEKFKEVDSDHKAYYEKMAEAMIKNWSKPAAKSFDAAPVAAHDSLTFTPSQVGHVPPEQNQFLKWLSLFPEGEKFKKTELIHWLDSLNRKDSSEVITSAEELEDLEDKGFLQRGIRNKRVSKIYMLNPNLECSKPKERHGRDIRKKRVPNIYMLNPNLKDSKPKERDGSQKELGESSTSVNALVNIGVPTLPRLKIEQLFSASNLRVVLLGRRKHRPDTNYIKFESYHLNYLKNLKEVRYLSLQGISGIIRLPDSIYELKELRYLDLRACNSLVLLAEGIQALAHLIYLDLSECYQLDHVPKEIACLSKLKVLKGFVLNPDSHVPMGHKGKVKKHASSSCALISDLSELKLLEKLTLRSRRMDFPKTDDLFCLRRMEHLKNLGITWVGTGKKDEVVGQNEMDVDFGVFPRTVEKLQLQAVPKAIGSKLLGLIREGSNRLMKLYIIGGDLENLGPDEYPFGIVEAVRLRYLKNLKMNQNEVIRCFPSLVWLEICECCQKEDHPKDDDLLKNGEWEIGKLTK